MMSLRPDPEPAHPCHPRSRPRDEVAKWVALTGITDLDSSYSEPAPLCEVVNGEPVFPKRYVFVWDRWWVRALVFLRLAG